MLNFNIQTFCINFQVKLIPNLISIVKYVFRSVNTYVDILILQLVYTCQIAKLKAIYYIGFLYGFIRDSGGLDSGLCSDKEPNIDQTYRVIFSSFCSRMGRPDDWSILGIQFAWISHANENSCFNWNWQHKP